MQWVLHNIWFAIHPSHRYSEEERVEGRCNDNKHNIVKEQDFSCI